MVDGQLTSFGLLAKMVLRKVLGSVTILNPNLEENCAQEHATLRSNVKLVWIFFVAKSVNIYYFLIPNVCTSNFSNVLF